MTPWDDYVAAARQLDAVRRDTARVVADQERAVQAARTNLAGVRHRIAIQRERIGGVATQAGRPLPIVEPHELDRRAAAMLMPSGVADPTPGIVAALAGTWATLDAADATLAVATDARAQAGPLADWPPVVRVALPYLWYAIVAVIALVIINAFAGSSGSVSGIALLFDLLVPCGAYVFGLVSVGLVFGPGRDGRRRRGGLVGAVICAVPLVLGLVLSFV